MENFQSNQDYHSDTGLLIAKVKTANDTMVIGTFFEYDLKIKGFVKEETFLMSHKDLMETLKDSDDGDDGDDDGDDSGQMQIVFTPEFQYNER